jgi:hypothetical protein
MARHRGIKARRTGQGLEALVNMSVNPGRQSRQMRTVFRQSGLRTVHIAINEDPIEAMARVERWPRRLAPTTLSYLADTWEATVIKFMSRSNALNNFPEGARLDVDLFRVVVDDYEAFLALCAMLRLFREGG